MILILLLACAGTSAFCVWCGYTVGYDHGFNDHEDGIPHRDLAPRWERWQRMWGRPAVYTEGDATDDPR